MKKLAIILIVFISLIGCSVYTPRTKPDSLIKPIKQYSGNLAFVDVVVGENVKAVAYLGRPISDQDAGEKVDGKERMRTGPVAPFFRTTLKDSITNTLEASNMFDKVGSIRYLMKATIKRVETFGGFSENEIDLLVQYELLNLQNGKIVFNDLINSHTKLEEFIYLASIRVPKAMEKVILDNMTKLVNSLHNNIKDEK